MAATAMVGVVAGIGAATPSREQGSGEAGARWAGLVALWAVGQGLGEVGRPFAFFVFTFVHVFLLPFILVLVKI